MNEPANNTNWHLVQIDNDAKRKHARVNNDGAETSSDCVSVLPRNKVHKSTSYISVPEIPSSLLIMILEYLVENGAGYSSCSLVSKEWNKCTMYAFPVLLKYVKKGAGSISPTDRAYVLLCKSISKRALLFLQLSTSPIYGRQRINRKDGRELTQQNTTSLFHVDHFVSRWPRLSTKCFLDLHNVIRNGTRCRGSLGYRIFVEFIQNISKKAAHQIMALDLEEQPVMHLIKLLKMFLIWRGIISESIRLVTAIGSFPVRYTEHYHLKPLPEYAQDCLASNLVKTQRLAIVQALEQTSIQLNNEEVNLLLGLAEKPVNNIDGIRFLASTTKRERLLEIIKQPPLPDAPCPIHNSHFCHLWKLCYDNPERFPCDYVFSSRTCITWKDYCPHTLNRRRCECLRMGALPSPLGRYYSDPRFMPGV